MSSEKIEVRALVVSVVSEFNSGNIEYTLRCMGIESTSGEDPHRIDEFNIFTNNPMLPGSFLKLSVELIGDPSGDPGGEWMFTI